MERVSGKFIRFVRRFFPFVFRLYAFSRVNGYVFERFGDIIRRGGAGVIALRNRHAAVIFFRTEKIAERLFLVDCRSGLSHKRQHQFFERRHVGERAVADFRHIGLNGDFFKRAVTFEGSGLNFVHVLGDGDFAHALFGYVLAENGFPVLIGIIMRTGSFVRRIFVRLASDQRQSETNCENASQRDFQYVFHVVVKSPDVRTRMRA